MPASTVVTGIGVAAPTGLGAEEFWARTLAGTNGIGAITRFDSSSYPVHLAGQISGFDAREHLPSRLITQTDRMTQLALVATGWALADAGVDPACLDTFDMGVVTASSLGGFEFGQRELENLWARGPRHVSGYMSFAWFYAVNTGQISIRHGMRGPSGVIVAEQAGGLDAIAQARRQVRKGVPLMITGGMDAPLSPWGLVIQIPGGRLSSRLDPARAYLPFDADACGYVAGEGGAILILEEGGAAAARGAGAPYGEIAGYCATFDPHPRSGRAPRMVGTIMGALEDAGLTAADIDVVFADAAGLPALDKAEADALRAVFGPQGVPVTAPKTMTGRLSAGGAPLDVAAALLALRDGVIPPTVNVLSVAPWCDLDLVTERRPSPLHCALIVARGHGGFNSALIVRTCRGPTTATTGRQRMRRFTFDDLQRAMRECAGEPEPVGQGDDLLDRTFDELGYDSIAVMTMTSKIERDLEVSLPEGEVGFADTLRDYLSFVNGRLAGQFRETR